MKKIMFRRQGTPQSVLFEQQLAAEALRLREQAEKMQPSAKRTSYSEKQESWRQLRICVTGCSRPV